MTIPSSTTYLSAKTCNDYNSGEGYGPKFYPGWYYQNWTHGDLVGPFKDEPTADWDEQRAHKQWAAGMVGGMLS